MKLNVNLYEDNLNVLKYSIYTKNIYEIDLVHSYRDGSLYAQHYTFHYRIATITGIINYCKSIRSVHVGINKEHYMDDTYINSFLWCGLLFYRSNIFYDVHE